MIMSLFISNRNADKDFQGYCENGYGWLLESEVDLESFATCFENFKKEHPEVALN